MPCPEALAIASGSGHISHGMALPIDPRSRENLGTRWVSWFSSNIKLVKSRNTHGEKNIPGKCVKNWSKLCIYAAKKTFINKSCFRLNAQNPNLHDKPTSSYSSINRTPVIRFTCRIQKFTLSVQVFPLRVQDAQAWRPSVFIGWFPPKNMVKLKMWFIELSIETLNTTYCWWFRNPQQPVDMVVFYPIF